MSDLIGKELGPYRILDQIGVGGMATVYRAYHAGMDRYVAIKVLLEHISRDEDVRKRFKREARVVARLEHPHILPVYDYGEEAERLFLVMRFIDAGTLKERMAAGPMALAEINRVLEQTGSALAYAHRLGVVHRDIKPANVLLDAADNCYLTDFGLARMMEVSVRLTATGVGLGTPAYMSPEQGQGGQVDARSDIYSLGVVLYEMVTGQVPYQAETPMAVVLQHITAPLPLPSEVKPDLHPQVERVILKALAKNPDDRYQTVEEMVAAFDAALRQIEAVAPVDESASAESWATAAPAKATTGEPAAAEAATPSGGAQLTRGEPAVREKVPWKWMRKTLLAVGGILLVVALAVLLSRIPFRVQISGGRVEVVQVAEEKEAAAATPELTVREGAVPAEETVVIEGKSEEAVPATVEAAEPLKPEVALPEVTITPSLVNVQMRLRIESTSDWAEVKLIAGGVLIHQQTVETGGSATTGEMRGRTIHLDQPITLAETSQSIYLVQDLTLGDVSEEKDIVFTVEKGCLGSTRVEVFNLATGDPVLIERVWNHTCDSKTFTVKADLLTTANPPSTPTPEPMHFRPVAPQGGQIVYICEGPTPHQLCVKDMASGQITQVTKELGFEGIGAVSWSPDGEQILLPAGSQQPDYKLYIKDAYGSDQRQLTFGEGHDQEAEWSPDGQWIAFYRDCDLWRVRPDGSGAQPLMVSGDYCTEIPTWSPDSQQIAFLYFEDGLARQIWVVNADGSDPHPVFSFDDQRPRRGGVVWSPDGSQVLCWYVEDENDEEQRVLVNADGSGVAGTIDGVPYWWMPSFWPRWGRTAPIGAVDTGMGGDLTIGGVVRDSAGWPAPHVYVTLSAYDEGGGFDMGKRGDWDLYTDETGSYSFDNLLRVGKGRFEVWFNGGREYGRTYENAGYRLSEEQIIGNVYALDVTVHPVTGSAFSGVISYEDLDGSVKDFYGPGFGMAPDRFISLLRGESDEDFEYSIGGQYYTIDGNVLNVNGLAGGTYYLQFQYRRSDGVLVYCTSPSFEIPAGETKRFDYTIRDCPPTSSPLPSGAVDSGMGGDLSIQGTVRDAAGNAVPGIQVEIAALEGGVFWEEEGSDYRQLGRWSQYTDQQGFYAFKNLLRVGGGHYPISFDGGGQNGATYESSGYYIMENEEGGPPYLLMVDDLRRAQFSFEFDEQEGYRYTLDIAVEPATGSALIASIQYEDADGETKNYFATPLGPDHFIELNRGTGPGDHEYTIGTGFASDGNAGMIDGLAGGEYYLVFQYVGSDGVWVDRVSPPFEIPPGQTKQFEYTIPLNP